MMHDTRDTSSDYSHEVQTSDVNKRETSKN